MKYRIGLFIIIITVIISALYLTRNQTPQAVIDYINNSAEGYEITSTFEDEFHHFILAYDNNEREVIYNPKSQKIINVVILDDAFRKCLDNE